MKTCPMCAESVQDAAVKCRFCGADLAAADGSATEPPASSLVPIVAVAAAAIVVVALGVVAGVFMRGRDAAPEATDAGARGRTSQEPYSFGVKWGAPPQTVSTQLMGRGLAFTDHDEDGDQVYAGVVDGHQALVIAMFARGGLAKVIVAFNTPADPKAAYTATVQRLTSRYGPPAGTPAAPSAQGRPVTAWPPRPDDTGETRVWTTITENDDVVVHYESGGWTAEAGRRKAS